MTVATCPQEYDTTPTESLPTVVLSPSDAQALVGPAAGGYVETATGLDLAKTRARALADLSARLARMMRKKNPSGGVRCLVIARDGGVFGVIWSERHRRGFIMPRHPELSDELLQRRDYFEKYRSEIGERLSALGARSDRELIDQVQEARVRAAAYLTGWTGDIEGRLENLRNAVHDSDIELFTPGEESFSQDDSIAAEPSFRDIDSLANQLQADYGDPRQRHTRYMDKKPIPNRALIVKITKTLIGILFPGYYGPRPNAKGFAGTLRRRLSWLREKLSRQIALAIRTDMHSEPSWKVDDDADDVWVCDWATDKAEQLLAAVPAIRWLLEQDVKAAVASDPAVWDHHEVVATYPGIYALAVYRLAHQLAKEGVPLIPRMMTEYAHSRTGIDIHPDAKIGAGFFIDHGTGVVIGQTSVIGRNCKIYQGVTLGALSFPRDEEGNLVRGSQVQRHPTLEDNVVVYANATVLGGETVVGRNSVIGANVWLPHSVGPETLALIEERQLRFKDRPSVLPKARDNRGDRI